VTSPVVKPLQSATAGGLIAGRSPLAQLLHALSQPLTGLQCSMEVALATPRTPGQYERILEVGLELTERIRAVVGAMQEVMDLEEEKNEQLDATELKTLLRDTLDDLAPVAEVKTVRVAFGCPGDGRLVVKARRRRMASTVFRLLESALSLAARGSVLLIEMGGAPTEAWFRVRWQIGRSASLFKQPELGLIVAQAALEHTGAVWERERTEELETVTVRLPIISDDGGILNPP